MRLLSFIVFTFVVTVLPGYAANLMDETLLQAEKGFVDAQLKLGNAYQSGQGVSKDYQKAFYWYEKAAVQGDAKAQRPLGTLYEMGLGVNKDMSKAAFWYEKAAQQGVARAQVNLGILYENGQGVGKNYQTALSWYQKAAAQGYGRGMNHLAMLYEKGLGVKKDVNQALHLYRQGADAQYSKSMLNLGRIYEHGADQGVEKNLLKASAWYEWAVQIGYTQARVDLKRVQALLVEKPEKSVPLEAKETAQLPGKNGIDGEFNKTDSKPERENVSQPIVASPPQVQEKIAVILDQQQDAVQSAPEVLDDEIPEEGVLKEIVPEEGEQQVLDQNISAQKSDQRPFLREKEEKKSKVESGKVSTAFMAVLIVIGNLTLVFIFWFFMVKKRNKLTRRSPASLEKIGQDIRKIRKQVEDMKNQRQAGQSA